MNVLSDIFIMLIQAVFVSNFVVIQFLGVCPFLGVSNKTSSAFGMGIAVTVIMGLATLVTFPLYTYVMVPLGIKFLDIIFFIFIIAALVQMLEMILKKFVPPLYKALGIYLPLITTNCAVLGATQLVLDAGSLGITLSVAWNMGYAVLFSVFSGIGFTVAIVLMSGVREKLATYKLPKAMQGFPISMVVACLMAMAFYVFTMVNL